MRKMKTRHVYNRFKFNYTEREFYDDGEKKGSRLKWHMKHKEEMRILCFVKSLVLF